MLRDHLCGEAQSQGLKTMCLEGDKLGSDLTFATS